jgi:hypothetical protein
MGRGTNTQRKPPNAVDRLLRAIWKVRSARRSEDLRELSDSELLMYMVDTMSNGRADRRPIMFCLAVEFAVGPDIDPACELLHEIGISDFEPDQVIAVRDSRVFAEFKQVSADYPNEDADYEQLDEYFKRLHTLAIAAGSIASEKSYSEVNPARDPLSGRSGNEPAGKIARIGRE